MTEIQIILKLKEYISIKDDIGNLDCDMCEAPCQKQNEIWYEGDFGTRALFICKECYNKLEEK